MNPISDYRDGALLRARQPRPTGHGAVERDLVISSLPCTERAVTRGGGGFKVVIDIGPLDHLREIDRHAVEQFTRL